MNFSFDVQDIKSIEAKLDSLKTDKSKSQVLKQLIEFYRYSDLNKADKYLSDLNALIQDADFSGYESFYYLSKGLIENMLYNYSNSNKYYIKGLDLLEDFGSRLELAEAKIEYIGTLLNEKKTNAVWELLDEISETLHAYPDPTIQGYYLLRMGVIHQQQGEYSRAIEFLTQAEELLTANNQGNINKIVFYRVQIAASLSSCYEMIDDREKAYSYGQDTIKLSHSFNIYARMRWNYFSLGRTCLIQDRLDEAEKYLKAAISYEHDRNQDAKAYAYVNLCLVYSRLNHHKAIIELLEGAEPFFRQLVHNKIKWMCSLNHLRGTAFKELGNFDQAILCYEQAMGLAEDNSCLEELIPVYWDYSIVMAEIGDYKAAYTYQVYHDEAKVEFSKVSKDLQIEELKRRNEAQRRRREMDYLKLKSNELQLQVLRAQMNPHFIGNVMTDLQAMVGKNSPDEIKKRIAELGALMKTMLHTGNQAYVSLEEEMEFLSRYLVLTKDMQHNGDFDFIIKGDDEIEDDIIAIPTMLIQPFVENCLEHGIPRLVDRKPFIRVVFKMIHDEELLVIIEDNGVGVTAAREYLAGQIHRKKRGVSTTLSAKRLEVLESMTNKKHSLSINEILDEGSGEVLGTRVEIVLPMQTLRMV